MSFGSSIKLTLPLAFLALLVAFASWPGVRPRPAEAAVNSISASSLLRGDGDSITITVTGTNANSPLAVTNNSDETFTVVSCNDLGDAGTNDCDIAPTGGGTGTINLNNGVLEGNYSLVLSMVLNCSDVESITVTADDASAVNRTVTVICVPNDSVPQVIIEKQATDDSVDYNFDWDSDDTCAVLLNGTVDVDDNGSFDLEDNDEAWFFCENSVTSLVVNEDDDLNFLEIEDCTEASEGVDDISGATIDFDISELESNDTVHCTWVNGELAATATAVAGPVTSVQVVANNITSCGGTTAVQVTLRNATGGPAPAGTSVTATSSAGGTFQPASTLTGNFPFSFATFLYQAPANFNGLTTITVRTSNNVAGVVNIQITCAAVVVPTPVVTVSPLKPPSAGDGGLLGGSSGGGFSPYLPSGLAATVAALALGLTVLARRQAAVAPAVVSLPAASIDAGARKAQRGSGFAVMVSLLLVAVALLAQRRRS